MHKVAIKYKPIPWQAWLISIAYIGERASFYAGLVCLTNFVQQPLPPNSVTGASSSQPGALNQGQSTATAISIYAILLAYVTPLLGATIADTFGKLRSIWIFSCVGALGYTLLVVAASPSLISDPNTSLAVLVVSITFWALGSGGLQPNIYALVGEQDEEENEDLMCRTISKVSDGTEVKAVPNVDAIYSIYYSIGAVGAFIGGVAPAYIERYCGFWQAWLLGLCLFLMLPAILLAGRKHIRETPASGCVPFVLRTCGRGFKNTFSFNPARFHRNWKAKKFWANAYPSSYSEETRPKWMAKFNDAWVEDVKAAVYTLKVCLWLPLFALSYGQINTNLVSQGNTMNDHAIASDVFSNVETIGVFIMVPAFEFLIFPALRRVGIELSTFKRISTGYMFGTGAMLFATILQSKIYDASVCGTDASNCDPTHISVFVQFPIYWMIGTAEALTVVSTVEYVISRTPIRLRHAVLSLLMLQNALGGILGEALAPLGEDPNLVYNYAVLTAITFIAGCLFYLNFRKRERLEAISLQAALKSELITLETGDKVDPECIDTQKC